MTSCLVCLDENVSMPEELKIPILGLQVEKDDEQQVYTKSVWGANYFGY
jgi:hypothetical protein